jgi:serine phosphatase RsbU (regulator of sigma subunit)
MADPYNPDQIRYKLTLALNNAVSEPEKSLYIINESISLAERAKDRLTIHLGYIIKGKYFIVINQYDDALIAFNQAYVNALETGSEMQINESVRFLSEVHIVKNFKSESLEYLYKGLELSFLLKDTTSISWYMIQIPEIEQEVGNIVFAMESALKAKNYFESQNDMVGLAKTLLTLGTIHNKLGNLTISRNHVQKAIELLENYQHLLLYGKALLTLGELLLVENRYYDAELYTIKAIEIFKPLNNNEYNRAKSFLGEILTVTKKYHEAYKTLMEVSKCQKENGDFAGISHTYLRKANLYSNTNQPYKAIEAFNSCITYSNNVGLNDLTRYAYKGLSQVMGSIGDYTKAYQSLSQYTRITDSLFNVQIISKATKLEEEDKFNQQQKEILTKELELERGKELISQQQQKQVLLYIVIALFFVIIVFAVREFIHKRQANLVLANQKEALERQKFISESRTRELTDSMNYAKYIQQAILRASLRIKELFPESFLILIPRDIVSGDFYWVKERNNRILFALADCTGHGVPGALMSIIGTYGLNSLVSEMNIINPGEVLNQINYLFEDSLEQQKGVEIFDGMDIAFCSYNPKSHELKYAGANIPLYILRSSDLPQPASAIISKGKNHVLYQVRPNKQSIGSSIDVVPFVTHSITLLENDIIYLFSDGFADQFGGPHGRKFMSNQLNKLICDFADLPLCEHKRILEETFYSWKKDAKQIDDVSFIGIKISGEITTS